MRVVALIENTKPEGRAELAAEHGLSLYIEHRDRKLLFDTGASAAFSRNAAELGVDLAEIDAVVISHHHYDHGGGLPAFFQANARAPVYVRGPVVRECYARTPPADIPKNIGMDRGLAETHPDRFMLVNATTEILPGVTIVTETSEISPRPSGNQRIFVKRGDQVVRDDFGHELLQVIEEDDGLVVFTGCSHRGILNLVEAVCQRHPDTRIKAVFGGFHLIGLPIPNSMANSVDEVREIGNKLMDYPVDQYFTGHCTGARAFEVLAEVMGERLEYCSTGSEVTL